MRVIMLSLIVAFLIACGGVQPPLPKEPPTGGRCGKDLPASPFQKKDATHILVADFFASRASEPDFADTVSHQVDSELKRYRDELRDPRKMDVEVPEGSLEIQRLRCFVEDHDRARAIAEALGADLVVWGKAFCNPTSQVTVVDQSHTVVQMRDVKAGGGSVIKIGTREVQAGKPYTVCPSATLYQRERDYRRDAERGMSLGSIGELDLPTLQSSEPFQLVHFTLGMHFYERAMFPLAARFFKQSADKVLAGERNVAALELMLGRAYMALPDPKQSLEYSRRALEYVRGTDSDIEARLENNIGSALRDQGDYEAALEHLRRALAIGEKIHGPDHPKVATEVNNIGIVLQDQGYHEAALEYFYRALVIDEKVYGPDHIDVATCENNIGIVLQAQGDHSGALGHFRRALTINQKVYGPDHPDVAIPESNIGTALHDQGDYKGALEHFHRALAINEKVYGPNHPDVAICENSIGGVLQDERDYGGALEHFRRALAIDEKVYGPDHHDVAICENNIGGVLQDERDYGGALEHYRRALAIDEKVYGLDHPDVAIRENTIGRVLQEQGDHKGALEHYRRALAIDEKIYGHHHPSVAIGENNIGGVLRDQGDYKGALEHYHRALAIFEKSLGHDLSTTRTIRRNIAIAIAEQSGWKQDDKHPGAIVVRCAQQDCHGLQPGDWLVSYGATAIRDTKHLIELVTSTSPDRPVTLTILRDPKKIRLPAHGGPLGIELL